MAGSLLSTGGNGLELVQRRADGILVPEAAEENPALEPEWEGCEGLVAGELPNGDSEDPVELLESALHRLGNPEEDHYQCYNIQTANFC